MGTIRKSKRSDPSGSTFALTPALAACIVLASAVDAGCGGAVQTPASSASPPAVADEGPPRRQPDGVVLEPASAVPEAEERGEAGGVVALRPPLGNEAVLAVVHRLFRAFAREDAEALQAILTDDASVLGFARGGRGANAKGGLLDQWKTRLKNPAYGRLAGVELVDRDRIERFRYEDLGGGGGGATAAPERPPGMRRDDLLVRFPVETPRLGAEQLFGDSMTLLLRRDGQTGMSYRIAGLGEEHAP